jgi:hypothetical protein
LFTGHHKHRHRNLSFFSLSLSLSKSNIKDSRYCYSRVEGVEDTRPERGVGQNEIRNVTQCKLNEKSGTNLMA